MERLIPRFGLRFGSFASRAGRFDNGIAIATPIAMLDTFIGRPRVE
jgi:hypothetical protein